MQGGALDDGVGRQGDGGDQGDGRNSPGAPYLDDDIEDGRPALLGGEFVGDGPAGGALNRPQILLHPEVVDLDHDAVNVIRQGGFLRRPLGDVGDDGVNVRAEFDVGVGAEAPGAQGLQQFPLGTGDRAGRVAEGIKKTVNLRLAVIWGSNWRTLPAAALRGLANTGSPAASRAALMRANSACSRYTSPRTSTTDGSPSACRNLRGTDATVRKLLEISSPVRPSPRVAPVWKTPCS